MLKSGIATLVLAIMFIMPTMAQNGKGKGKTPQERATHATEKLSKKLGLDAAQTQQLAILNQDFANELSSIKDQDTDRETKRAAIKAAKDQHQSQIQGILNAEQQAKFQQMVEKRKERMKNRRGKRGKGKTPQERATHMTEKLSKKLGLDAAQTQQLASLNQAFANELSSIKDQDTDRETKRAAIKAAKDLHQSQIQGILNAEQQAKFQKMVEKRKERMKNRRGKRGSK